MSREYPVVAEEPAKRLGAWHTGDSGYVVIAWTYQQPTRVHVYCGFRTVTDARSFGRTYFKRRYLVSGAWKWTTAIAHGYV